MANNPLIPLAERVMLERYDLDPDTYYLLSFSEGQKSVTIKMTNDYIPVSATFPKEFLELEKIDRMSIYEIEEYINSYKVEHQVLPNNIHRHLIEKGYGGLIEEIYGGTSKAEEVPEEIVEEEVKEEKVSPKAKNKPRVKLSKKKGA